MLSQASFDEADNQSWGLSWKLDEVDGKQLVRHGGYNPNGYGCYSEFWPESGNGLVVMTNSTGGYQMHEELVAALRERRLPE